MATRSSVAPRGGSVANQIRGTPLIAVIMLVALAGGIDTGDAGNTETISGEDTCSDGLDNDMDGFTDGEDAECNPLSPFYDGNENDGSV